MSTHPPRTKTNTWHLAAPPDDTSPFRWFWWVFWGSWIANRCFMKDPIPFDSYFNCTSDISYVFMVICQLSQHHWLEELLLNPNGSWISDLRFWGTLGGSLASFIISNRPLIDIGWFATNPQSLINQSLTKSNQIDLCHQGGYLIWPSEIPRVVFRELPVNHLSRPVLGTPW